jgi:hypothetical protein
MTTLLVEQQSGAIYIALQQILPSCANEPAGLAGAPMVATLIVHHAFSQKRRTAGLHLDCIGRKAHVACNKG